MGNGCGWGCLHLSGTIHLLCMPRNISTCDTTCCSDNAGRYSPSQTEDNRKTERLTRLPKKKEKKAIQLGKETLAHQSAGDFMVTTCNIMTIALHMHAYCSTFCMHMQKVREWFRH